MSFQIAERPMLNRRESLKSVVAAGIGALGLRKLSLAAKAGDMISLPIGNGERPLVAYPGKRPLIRLTRAPAAARNAFQRVR
jgi:hypothetical protein